VVYWHVVVWSGDGMISLRGHGYVKVELRMIK